MTAAVVVATTPAADGSAAALLRLGDSTLLRRLLDQISSLGVHRVAVIARPEWRVAIEAEVGHDHAVEVVQAATTPAVLDAVSELAGSGRSTLLLAAGDILASDDVLAGLLNDPRVNSGIVASTTTPAGPYAMGVRLDRGRVTSVQTAYHGLSRTDAAFLGLVKVDAAQRPELARVAGEIAALCRDGMPRSWQEQLALHATRWHGVSGELESADAGPATAVSHPVAVATADSLALLVAGLVRSGATVTCSYKRSLFWYRPAAQDAVEAALERMAGVDEDAIRLASAVKAQDGFFTTFFVSPYSKYIARWAARRGRTPNEVTSASMVVGIAAACMFAIGNRFGLVAGALLLQVAFTLDCVDGQLARYTRQFSALGAWLDSVFDRAKEYVVFAGLAIGGVRIGEPRSVWLLAAAALAVQTTRHTLDFAWAASQHKAVAALPPPPIAEPSDTFGETALPGAGAPTPPSLLAAVGRLAVNASRAFERRSWTKWVKRIVVLPIGERFALISLTAALFTPRVTFVALLVWSAVAIAYSVTGRVLRSVV